MSDTPILYDWDGECFSPSTRFWQARAEKMFEAGKRYKLAPVEERSVKAHNHEFAVIADCWESLPDHLKFEFPTPEHLRKRALIMRGYCHMREHVAASKAEAQRLAAFIRPFDEYAMIHTVENVVRVFTPMSQSRKAMPEKGQFQESKEAVLDWCQLLLEDPSAAMSSMGRAA